MASAPQENETIGGSACWLDTPRAPSTTAEVLDAIMPGWYWTNPPSTQHVSVPAGVMTGSAEQPRPEEAGATVGTVAPAANEAPAEPVLVDFTAPEPEYDEADEDEDEDEEEEVDDRSTCDHRPLERCSPATLNLWIPLLRDFNLFPATTDFFLRYDHHIVVSITHPATHQSRAFIGEFAPWPSGGIPHWCEQRPRRGLNMNEFMLNRDLAADLFRGHISPITLHALLSAEFGGARGGYVVPGGFDWRATLSRARRGNQKLGAPKNKLP